MRLRRRWFRALGCLAVAAVVLLAAAPARAQVFTPSYLPPTGAGGLGVSLSSGPGDFAAEWLWRQVSGRGTVGLRAGVADVRDAALLVGGEYRWAAGLLQGLPLETALAVGAQAVVGDVDWIGVQAGVTAGRSLPLEGVVFTPYLYPRVALVSAHDDLDVELLADLGADVRLDTGWLLRLSLGFGAELAEAGIAVSWP